MRLESLGAEDRCADRSLVCVVTGDPFGGTCVLGATEGEACGEGRRCSTGHVCVGGVCVARALPGAECVAPEVCVPFHTCMAGRCVPLPLVGDSCDVLPCVYGMCEDGVCRLKNPGEPCELGECSTYCDTETGLCGTPTPEGEACESFFQCEPGLTCWGPPDDAGVCRRC